MSIGIKNRSGVPVEVCDFYVTSADPRTGYYGGGVVSIGADKKKKLPSRFYTDKSVENHAEPQEIEFSAEGVDGIFILSHGELVENVGCDLLLEIEEGSLVGRFVPRDEDGNTKTFVQKFWNVIRPPRQTDAVQGV